MIETEPQVVSPRPQRHAGQIAWWTLLGLATVMAVAIGVLDVPREVLGLLVLGLMVTLIFLGIPVAISMASASIYGLFIAAGMAGLIVTLEQFPFQASANWQLSVVPMFILMGFVIHHSGLSSLIYEAARAWLGRLPGGTAIATNWAGAGMAAASGSTIGIAYALGNIAIPEMLRSGYDKRLATGVVTQAGTLGQLIPPSILAVIYSGVAGTPVGVQLLAGLVPGILLAILYSTIILVWVKVRPLPGHQEVDTDVTWRDRWLKAARVWPLLFIIIAVVGGIYGGIFTATEAGAFGAMAAIVIALPSNRGGFRRMMWAALRDTVYSTTAIMFLLVSVGILNRLLAITNVASWIAQWLNGLDLSSLAFIGMLIVLYLILGMFMDPIGMMLLTVPIFSPTIVALDIDFVWFGVFIVLMGEIAIISPPVGVQTFIIHRLCQEPGLLPEGVDIGLWDVFGGVIRMGIGDLTVVLTLIAFPGIIYLFM